jgi:peptide/nickel transport system permease protein
MIRFLAARVASALLAALLSSLVVFVLMRAVPGDIVAQMLGQAGDPAAAAALRRFFGLDRPVLAQFLDWLGQVLQGDLGRSWYQGRRVAALVWDAFGVTFQVAAATLILATLIGVPLGVMAGIAEGTRLDAAIQTFNLVGLSAPVFWVGLMLLVGASAVFGWSPPFAYMPPSVDPAETVAILILPVLSLALLQAAAYSHFVRDCMVAELRRDYVRAAFARGLSPAQIHFRHALRNILIPLVTFMGLILVQILGGTVVIESLFSLPGLGRLILSGIQGRDYPVVLGALLFVVAIAIATNLAVDLLYGLIDPRLRP